MGMMGEKKPLGAIIVARAHGGPEEDGSDGEDAGEEEMKEKAKMAATDAIFKAIESKDHKAFVDAFEHLADLCDDDSEEDGDGEEDGIPEGKDGY